MLNDGRAGSRPKKEIRGEGMHRESILLPGTRWNHSRPEESKPAPIAVVHVFFSILCSIPEGEAALNASAVDDSVADTSSKENAILDTLKEMSDKAEGTLTDARGAEMKSKHESLHCLLPLPKPHQPFFRVCFIFI